MKVLAGKSSITAGFFEHTTFDYQKVYPWLYDYPMIIPIWSLLNHLNPYSTHHFIMPFSIFDLPIFRKPRRFKAGQRPSSWAPGSTPGCQSCWNAHCGGVWDRNLRDDPSARFCPAKTRALMKQPVNIAGFDKNQWVWHDFTWKNTRDLTNKHVDVGYLGDFGPQHMWIPFYWRALRNCVDSTLKNPWELYVCQV